MSGPSDFHLFLRSNLSGPSPGCQHVRTVLPVPLPVPLPVLLPVLKMTNIFFNMPTLTAAFIRGRPNE